MAPCLFAAIIFLSSTSIVSAQALKDQATPFITNYKRTEIFDSQYWSAVQDHRGIMYFGVNAGIVEFDGINYKLIKTPTGNVIRTLCMSSDSVIYAGGANDFGYLAFTNTGETIFVSLVDKLKREHRNFTSVNKVLHTKKTTWFLADKGKVFKWQNDSISALPFNLFSRFGAAVYDKLFLFQPDRGIAVVENDLPAILPHTLEFTRNSAGKIELLPFAKNKLLIVTKNKGLYIYHYDQLPKEGHYSDANVPPSIVTRFETDVDEYILRNIVYPCIQLDSTHYAFGTLLGGIVIIDEQGKLVRMITENHGLHDNIIYCLYTDRNKNLWALTSNGVSYVEVNSSISSFNNDGKISKNLSYAAKHEGILYVSHDKGISYLQDHALKGSDKKELFSPVQGIIGRVAHFCAYRDIILCEADNKLYAIHRGRARKLGDITTIHDIIPSKKFGNTFFYASENSGMGYFELEYRSRTGFPEVKLSRLKNFPSLSPGVAIAEDPQGNILLSSRQTGIYHIRFKNNFIDDHQIVRYDMTHGLPSMSLDNFMVYDNRLFVNSAGGLFQANTVPARSFCCDSISGFVTESYFKERLAGRHRTIFNATILNNNQFWLNTDKGSGLVIEHGNGQMFWKTIPLAGISPNSVTVDDNGIYWITSNSWLFRYDPSIKDQQKRFYTLIRKISAGDSVIFKGAYVNPGSERNGYFLRTALGQPGHLLNTFGLNNNSLTFECASSSFEGIGNNLYSYFLEGADKNWSEWSSKSKKEYSFLPPGKYSFKVRAMNVHGDESFGEATYSFEVIPPWYQTTLAYVGYFVFGLGLISGGVRLYYNRLIQSKRRLEKIVEDRTSEIREKNIQLSDTVDQLKELHNFKESMIHMIVHDLKNPLNTIIGFGRERQTEKMSAFVLHSGRTMLNMVENILNVHKFEESKIKLNVETYDIKEVIREVLQEVAFIANEREIRIKDNSINCTFLFDVELIKRVLVNLLTNAIKFSPCEGEVIIGTEILEQDHGMEIRASIEDNGTGIPANMTDKIFDKYIQVEARKLGIAHSTGLGLTFCKLVVEAHKGKIGVKLKPAKGSVFYFTLPVI